MDARNMYRKRLKVHGVSNVSVDLQKEEAIIEMESHIPLEKFQTCIEREWR